MNKTKYDWAPGARWHVLSVTSTGRRTDDITIAVTHRDVLTHLYDSDALKGQALKDAGLGLPADWVARKY